MRWTPDAETARIKCLEMSSGDREGQYFFDREAKITIQLLEALRQQIGRAGRCDIALFEDLRAIRDGVEAMAYRAEKLMYSMSYGSPQTKHQMPRIYRGRGANASVRKRQRHRQPPADSRRTPPQASRSVSQPPSQQASMWDPSLLCHTSCSDSRSGATPVPWFDLVRPVPDVSMEELCRPQTSLANILDGGDSRTVTPSADRGYDAGNRAIHRPGGRWPGRAHHGSHPPRPATCTPTLTGHRRSSRRSGVEDSVTSNASASFEAAQAVPRRPASSMDCVSPSKRYGGDEAASVQTCGPSEVQETGSPPCGSPEDCIISGEIHIEATVEVTPGEMSPILPEQLDFQVSESPLAVLLPVWPASLPVTTRGGYCGGVVLEVGDAHHAELRVLIAGPGGQESTRVPIARVLQSAGGAGQEVPLEWNVDDWCTVHLRATLYVEEAVLGHRRDRGGSPSSAEVVEGSSVITTAAPAAASAPPAAAQPSAPTRGTKASGTAAVTSRRAPVPSDTPSASQSTSGVATAPVPRPPASSREEIGRRPRPMGAATVIASAAPGCIRAAIPPAQTATSGTAEEAEAIAAYVRRMLLRGSNELRRRAARQATGSLSAASTTARSRPQSASRSRPQSANRQPPGSSR